MCFGVNITSRDRSTHTFSTSTLSFPAIMFQYLTLYNNSFKRIYMFLQSVLQVTATDSAITIMSCLNAFFSVQVPPTLLPYWWCEHYDTWIRGHHRSATDHTSPANCSSESHSNVTSRYYYGHLPNIPHSFLRIWNLQHPYTGGRVQCTILCSFDEDFRRAMYVLIKLYLGDYFEVDQIC
jgi:hypothetical protein